MPHFKVKWTVGNDFVCQRRLTVARENIWCFRSIWSFGLAFKTKRWKISVLYEQIYEYPKDLIKTLSKYLLWIIYLYKSNFIWGRKHIMAAYFIQHVHKTSISGFVYGCVGWNKHCKRTWTSDRQQGSTILQQKEKKCSQCLGSVEKCRKRAREEITHINQRQESIEPVILSENLPDGLWGELETLEHLH